MIIERVLTLLEEKSLRMADLCRFLDINTSTMTNWKNRRTDPPARLIVPICEFLDVSCDYLLTGKEPQAPQTILSSEDSEWLKLIHSLPRDAQLEFRGELKGYLKAIVTRSSEEEPLRQAK